MKIGKTFGMTISGNYQSYKFETSMELNTDDFPSTPPDGLEAKLTDLVVKSTEDDIKKYAANDSNFSAVLGTRNAELEKVRVRQAHQ
jgi:hypothetical protein